MSTRSLMAHIQARIAAAQSKPDPTHGHARVICLECAGPKDPRPVGLYSCMLCGKRWKIGQPDRPVCGAQRSRGRGLCQATALYPNGRCRMHGGPSTGPKTDDGKQRAQANIRTVRRRRLMRFSPRGNDGIPFSRKNSRESERGPEVTLALAARRLGMSPKTVAAMEKRGEVGPFRRDAKGWRWLHERDVMQIANAVHAREERATAERLKLETSQLEELKRRIGPDELARLLGPEKSGS